jgi:hypothetical protein
MRALRPIRLALAQESATFRPAGETTFLTRDEFLELLGLTSGTFDQAQHSGHVALAFGTTLPARPGRYLDFDLVAMAINLGLTPSIGRKKRPR